MRAHEVFADVLEEELARLRADRRRAERQGTGQAAPADPFIFVRPRRSLNSTAYGRPPAEAPAPPPFEALARQEPPMPNAGPEPTVPPAYRILAAGQRRALCALVNLGADLRDDFTAAELRTAFRALARRYHPDSHPHCSSAAKTRLSRQFAEISDHYRLLLAVIEPVGTARH